ncbi:hypothetical protein HPB47_027603 [Ixodes persulcatus]|uniref:Uncharacterized protein n=1 Tax=Ixodes persulcatus TaxID=34615 RepID=A0AC60PVE1_IXOPE|nr:hypothetical protein HPB47_027603 [Ixodes persulcatus]
MDCTPIFQLLYPVDRRNRSHRDAFELPEHVFRKQYHLAKTLVRWLCDELREEPELQRLRRSSTVVTVEDQVLCALRFYATGSFQGMVASDEHIARDQGTVSIALRAVSVAIVRRLGIQHGWIHFPQTASERDDFERGFQLLGRIPGVIGCIDETMIRIVGPFKYDPTVRKAAYWCKKQYYALNVMVKHIKERQTTASKPDLMKILEMKRKSVTNLEKSELELVKEKYEHAQRRVSVLEKEARQLKQLNPNLQEVTKGMQVPCRSPTFPGAAQVEADDLRLVNAPAPAMNPPLAAAHALAPHPTLRRSLPWLLLLPWVRSFLGWLLPLPGWWPSSATSPPPPAAHALAADLEPAALPAVQNAGVAANSEHL